MPVVNAAYLTLEEANELMHVEEWDVLSDDQKNTLLNYATKLIDTTARYIGTKVDSGQAREFPRTITGLLPEDDYTAEEQLRRCKMACRDQAEYELSRLPIGVVEYSLGSETIKPTGRLLCYQAESQLFPYIYRRPAW